MTMRVQISFVEYDDNEEYNRGAIEVMQSKYDSDVETWRHALRVAMTAAGYSPETIDEALNVEKSYVMFMHPSMAADLAGSEYSPGEAPDLASHVHPDKEAEELIAGEIGSFGGTI